MASLQKEKSIFADKAYQLQLLKEVTKVEDVVSFREKISAAGHTSIKPSKLEIFQINLGYMCNQTCGHCHVDAGPDRKEIMTQESMQQCLDVLANSNFTTVDLTGGAPEMNPHFRWFVEEVSKLGIKTIVRCNLTIIVANKKYNDLPEFYKKHNVEVVSSLPFYNADKTDRQRGKGVFKESLQALKMLNAVGYGIEGSGLTLNLVYNPSGAFLPSGQAELEAQFKHVLKDEFDLTFNSLFSITNIPISRFLEYLVKTENYETYMQKLVDAYNPASIEGLMCRNTISISWDGYIYDCDFNQMLDLKVDNNGRGHISQFDGEFLQDREIQLSQHCYGCTAGAGSSCGGEIVG